MYNREPNTYFERSTLRIRDTHKYCANCDSHGHVYNECREPITSWGIILVKLNGLKLKNLQKTNLNKMEAKISARDDIENINARMTSLEFLMVRRRYSLGYVVFLKGDYRPSNLDGVNFIFAQMMSHEIEDIKTKEFDQLWYGFWDYTYMSPKKKERIKRMYKESKSKYTELKKGVSRGEILHYDLKFIIDNAKPSFREQEWGFPKGRKNARETSIDCAIREFREETGLKEDDVKLLTNIEPITENLIGTDGKEYRHVYYVGVLTNNDAKPSIAIGDTRSCEVGAVQFLPLRECESAIRSYHKEKKDILMKLYSYLVEHSEV